MQNFIECSLQNSIKRMTDAVAGILSENSPSVYLYGSAAAGDFRLGWSDIDILVLTREPITAAQAERLLRLRQTLTQGEPGNPYYRLFEGGMLSLSAFLSGAPDTVVYWGTSGERIAQKYEFNSFSREELFTNGVLLFGEDVRAQIPRPTYEDLRVEVQKHLASVRAYGGMTGESLYSFGWLLDISRCIYTLRTGRVIAKTAAGEWALTNGLCPNPAALQTAVRLRYEPERFQKEPELRTYAASLGDTVRQYADVLQTELEHRSHLVLGAREIGVDYFDRPGAYLIAVRDGKLAVVQTKRGFFLPGGGLECGESDESCILREVLEETGCPAEVGAFLGSAEHYTAHETKGPFHPIQSYYAGTIGEPTAAPTEPGHRFLWQPLNEIRDRLYSAIQNRALESYCITELK